MKPPNPHQRINLAELKAQLVKKLGPEGSMQYFHYLSRFLSLQLAKVEFNKLCIQIVGRENIQLHNQFICSILRNACNAKVPPPCHDKDVLKSVRAVGNREDPSERLKQSVPNSPVFSNGDVLALSPRKARPGTHDRKVLDHRPNGNTHFVSLQSSTEQCSNSNGFLGVHRPLQRHQGLTDQGNNEEHFFTLTNKLPCGSLSVYSEDATETVSSENQKVGSSRSALCSPLGVQSYPVSSGVGRKTMPLANSITTASSFDRGYLLDTITLRQRMEQIAAIQGLGGVVPVECANLLNNGLDAYLKGLIVSCIELVGARPRHDPTKSCVHKHQAHLNLVNGVRPYHHNVQSTIRQTEGMQDRRPQSTISLSDFRVAMELNPQQLGEDWPLSLEKICTHSFEE